MALQRLLLIIGTSFSISFLTFQSAKSEMPAFAFSWQDDRDAFVAGDTATIKVRVLGNYEGAKYKFPFKPNVTVNDKIGNSSLVTAVALHFDEDWSITFSPIMVGLFNVLITDVHFHVLDSSLHFRVDPGQMYPEAGILSWADGINEFVAGSSAQVLILPKDAFGNNVSSGSKLENVSLFASTSTGVPASVVNIVPKGWNEHGYISFEFVAATAGNLLLHVEIENRTLHASPLSFVVYSGKLDVHSCVAQLNVETKYFQLFSIMEGLIKQQDQYGNMVSGSYEFDVEVVEKGTNLSMPLADLVFKQAGPGARSFSFSLYEPGDFMLMISHKENNTLISNMPYNFTVFTGYCDGVNSIVNGSGLNKSVAGNSTEFSVFLRDSYLYPSPVMLEILHVHIAEDSSQQIIHPSIRIRRTANANASGNFYSGMLDAKQIASAPVVDPRNNFTENWNRKASDFDVVYVPEKSGVYMIHCFCGNVELNGGHPFRKEVVPGFVNISVSGVVKYAKKVPKLVKNKVVVQLVDSYRNPVISQESNLKLEIASINNSAFSIERFLDNNDGSYTVEYMANDVGTYEICASCNGERFLPCPFGVNVYDYEYFPRVHEDVVSVWEDESIDFDVLGNDIFSGVNATIVEHSKPSEGSILLYGDIFRYTPYKGFYGNDSFSYTIADANGNLASADVDLLILCKPPQFVSIPTDLQATEDVVSPTFGGYGGLEIKYSNLGENVSVTLSSKSGSVLLCPRQMQFWQASRDELSVRREAEGRGELRLGGSLDGVNSALQSIQYFGDHDFYGADMIRVVTRNANGENDIDVPVFVQPINDPPVINTPPFVILDGIRVFGNRNGKVKLIEDPDLVNFPGNRSRFLIMLSMEVSVGAVSASLPAELVRWTEVKMKSSYQWQPVETFVTISHHFLVKGKGIRFRGSIDECNSILEELTYHEGDDGGALSVTVNDLGNHGCYPGCDEMMSVALLAESTVALLRREPMTSLAATALGSAIILESIAVLCLGMLLLFYICKCVVRVRDNKRRKCEGIELSKLTNSKRSRRGRSTGATQASP